MEPENEGVYFRRTQRHPHYRSSENPQDVPRSEPLRERTFRTRPNGFIRGHQTAGPGSGRRRGQALRSVFREPPLAGRDADELGDATEVHQAAEAAEGHERRWAHERAVQERTSAAGPRDEALVSGTRTRRELGPASGRHVRDRVQRGRDRGEGSAAHGRAGGFGGGYELRPGRGGLDYSRKR